MSKRGWHRIGKETNTIRGNYAEIVVNISKVNFTVEENKSLGKELKYIPSLSINREKAKCDCEIVEHEIVTDKILTEESMNQVRHEVSNIIEKAHKISKTRRKKMRTK